jgi:cysteine-rich repeat protein
MPAAARLALAVAVVGLAAPRVAAAHQRPLRLDEWGPFGATAARCQRALGSAATGCGLEVWAARRACIEPQLAGGQCDHERTEAAVLAARQHALDKVERYCSDVDLISLRFVGGADALADVTTGCRLVEAALVSGAYGPALVDTVVVPVGDTTRACLRVGAVTLEHMVRFVGRAQRAALDRIASNPMTADKKLVQVTRARQRIRRAMEKFAARASAACSPDQFDRLYHHAVDVLVDALAGCGECLTGMVYAQDTLVCGPPTCGNGVMEPREECDDGNANDADWCRSDCTRNE